MFASATNISEFLAQWLSKETLPEAEQKILWQYYASHRRHFPPRLQHYYRRQTDEIMELLRRNPGARVLEIGCGTGTESLWMAMQGAQVDAIELSQERYRTAMARKAVLERELGRTLQCRFINETVFEMAVTQPYDVLWMEQTFHHLEPREAMVDKLVAIVRRGGHIVVSEANGLNPLLQAQLWAQRGFSFKTVRHFVDHKGREHPYGDERVLSARSLSRLFRRRGVEQVSLEHYRLFPSGPNFDGLLSWEEAAPRWLPPLFTHYNYVGIKRATLP